MTPQEMADIQYGKGYRDGKVEAILALLDLIQDCHLEYVAKEVVDHIHTLNSQARKRMGYT